MSISVPFGCVLLLLLAFARSPSAAPARTVWGVLDEEPGEFPFEFSTARGSKVTADNVLTQSVSSDGGAVFKTNDPQPIVKYGGRKDGGGGGGGGETGKTHTAQSAEKPDRKTVYFVRPPGKKRTAVHDRPQAASESPTSVPSDAGSPSAAGQWAALENLFKYMYPGTTGIKITYRYT